MNSRTPSLTSFVLLMAILACGPLASPTSSPLATSVPHTQPPSPEVPSPTLAAVLSAPTAEPSPTHAAPQPAAAAHFRAGDPVQLDSISMISRTEGWGLSGSYVLTTVDGGQTWREATPPQSSQPGTQTHAYGAFLDAETAWIVFAEDGHILAEASVWNTTDAGRTWTPGAPLFHQAIGDSVWAEFAVLDARNVWVMMRGVYVGAGTHYNHELFHTTDGGLTWTSLDGEISNNYTGMVFADTAFALRTLQTTGAYAASPPAYDVTTDGGVTWEGRELPPPPEAPELFTQYPYCETYQPVVLSSQAIRMLVGCFDYYDPPRESVSYFYSTQNGGVSWSTIRLPDTVRAADDRLLWFGLNNALLLGRDMYLTTSDGQTWSFVKSVNWDGQFTFSDPQYGWAIARSDGEVALVQTMDWAATWSVIKPTITR